jgi:hypothetical protein
MEFTYFGALATPLGVLLLFIAPQLLLDLSIFFIPFSATSIVNITKSADSASGLPPWMFFGALYMVSEAVRVTATRRHLAEDSPWKRLPIPQMLFFALAIFASLIMPWWINGDLLIQSPYLGQVSKEPLYFGLKNVTASLYIVYGLLYLSIIAAQCAEVTVFRRYLRLYCLSGLFVCVWGGFQFVLNGLDLPYPAIIFNSSVSPGADLYIESTVSGLKRISSVAVEPSVLAQYLLTVLPFVLFRLISRRPLISPGWDRAVSAIVFITLIVSTSVEGYVGLILLIPLLVIAIVRSGLLRISHLAVGGVAFCAVCGFAIANSAVSELIKTDVIGKLSTGSGLERAGSITIAMQCFYQYPFLGVGWGSVTSWDLVAFLLANTGVLGAASLLVFLGSCLNRLRRHCSRQHMKALDLASLGDSAACLVAMVLLLLLNAMTGFAYVFGHFWFLLGLSVGIPMQGLIGVSSRGKQFIGRVALADRYM